MQTNSLVNALKSKFYLYSATLIILFVIFIFLPPGPASADKNLVLTTPSLITPTPTPTITSEPKDEVARPLNDPGKYQLDHWSEQKAFDAIAILDEKWKKEKEENTWIYAQAGINSLKKVAALVEQETLSRYPQLSSRENLEWKLALDLATSGQQNATQYLAKLLQSALDQKPSLLSNNFSDLQGRGFTFEVLEATKLFNETPNIWMVKAQVDDFEYSGGGTVFSIHTTSDGHYRINPVGGYWLPYWGQDFQVFFNPTMTGMKPEVSILQQSSHGTGDVFRESWLCNYQWDNNRWVPVLTDTISETRGTFGLDFTFDKACFISKGLIGDSVLFSKNKDSYIDTIQLSKPFIRDACGWEIWYFFHKENNIYQQLAEIKNIENSLTDPHELYCLESAWDMASIVQNKKDIISYMEYLMDDWPSLLNEKWDVLTRQDFGSPRFYNQLQFQLGRFYALSGEIEKAKRALSKVTNRAPDRKDRWAYIASHYLSNINDIKKAEDGYNRDVLSFCSSCKSSYPVKPVYEKAIEDLSTNRSLNTVKNEIQTLISRANPSCYGKENYRCAELFYLYGLAHEINGNKSEAITAYWLVWKNFPESFYAIAAQQKLERKPGN